MNDDTTTIAAPAAKRPGYLFLGLMALLIALVAGGAGAAISHAAFPAKDGKTGARGAAGVAGPAGPAGPAGNAATAPVVDTDKVGYCFNASYNYSGTTYVTGVNLFAPTDNNGTLSCTSGQFVSLTPITPQGTPVANYDPSAG